MNTFVNAVTAPQLTQTQNGMTAFTTTGKDSVDLFFNIGSARNDQAGIKRTFYKALADSKTIAARILFWARDVRGGAGERQTFRNLMLELEQTDQDTLKKLIPMVPEYGRWDDLLIFQTREIKALAYQVYALGIRSGDGLAAKWAPRKGKIAAELRNALGLTPKQYRKMIVGLSNTVEQKMCAQEWTAIEFDKLPSIAAKQYMKAFTKHAPLQYAEYKSALVKGDAKINASAIFPHDVIRGIRHGDSTVGAAQWNALPNYIEGDDNFILPMVDVSGSMQCPVKGSNVECIDVALALGLYLADKQTGAYAGMFLTFSETTELVKLKGDILQKMRQMHSSNWGMNTNIARAFHKVLNTAVECKVDPEDMPKYILILSDMQFDMCAQMSGMDMMEYKYAEAGYKVPKIIFWNLNASFGNTPVTMNKHGVALVSGFSPAIMKSILNAKSVTPEAIMLDTINSDRYANINL